MLTYIATQITVIPVDPFRLTAHYVNTSHVSAWLAGGGAAELAGWLVPAAVFILLLKPIPGKFPYC